MGNNNSSLMPALQIGYKNFRQRCQNSTDSMAHLHTLATGQAPETFVLACCDSRVDPAIIFDAQLGELFVSRCIATAVPQYCSNSADAVSAALEFSVKQLKVKQIVLLGHSNCIGMQTAIQQTYQAPTDKITENTPLTAWIEHCFVEKKLDPTDIDAHTRAALIAYWHRCEQYPFIQEAIKQKILCVVPCFFEIGTAKLYTYLFSTQTWSAC